MTTLLRTCLALSVGCCAAISRAEVPDHGYEWATIGDPGNRPVNENEGPRFHPPFPPRTVGTVNYGYRMAKTEVSVGQWLEFVNAYAPYYDGPLNGSAFTGIWIRWSEGDGRFVAREGTEGLATSMSWHYAARYVNWLHNDKVTDQWAFEDGAYDTSTFHRNPDGMITDQATRHPDAKFWIPNLDEWTKAMHWDPTKGDSGGYWQYPHSSDDAPIPGPPGIGETSADIWHTDGFFDVGSYVGVESPWGLLDGSGSELEWLEDLVAQGARNVRGSSWALPVSFDEIDHVSAAPPQTGGRGLRIASIPTPGSACIVGLIVFTKGSRRRR